MTFLEKIADEVLKEGKNRLSKYCFVFPTRRNGIYFRNILSKKIDSPIWSPEILSIEDFFGKLSPYTIADNLLLIFELHRVYGTSEAFDSFYSWGEMVLSDFDEVDKFLVPAEILFKKVKEFKDIDDAFPVELQEEFKKFWETIFNSKTDLKNDFVKIWEVLGEIYSKFNASLKSQGIAYKGRAYKEVCRKILDGEINFEWEKIIFSGFNSLNKCEEKIIQKLLDEGKAVIYWDSDEYYINDDKQEAGHFLRKNFKTFRIKNSNWVENNLLTDEKNLSVTGIPLNMGQAKLTGKLLKELLSGKNFKSETTVLVLPDENMLLPVLYSLPDEIKELNVTMGFKFRNTPLFNLLMLIKSLLESKKGTGENIRFYHKDFSSILQHPYIKLFDSNYTYELVKEITKGNYVYVGRKNILKGEFPQILDIIFSEPPGIKEIFIYLRAIIDLIAGKFENKPSAYENFQLEYIFSLYLHLNRFEDILNEYNTTVSPNMFWKILKDVLNNISIPFTGEPLKGLQIMGLLETRGLDFENVIVLSVNEKIVPRGNFHNSFIPYPLRKAFKMPVYDDNDSITAYYFYRLLQRAKNINLISTNAN